MMKIVFPSEDGRTISRHFGRAPYLVVATVQEGEPVKLEQRQKAFHGQQEEPHAHETGQHEHMHADMFAVISDCQVLISGGMGQPAYDSAIQHGLKVIMTGETDIDSALKAYQEGKLTSDLQRIHRH